MDYLARLGRLQKRLECDCFIVEEKVNLYYLTGLELSAGTLLVFPERALLLVDNRYYEKCKKLSPFPVELFDKNLSEYLAGTQTLGFDSENCSFKRFLEFEKLGKTLVPLENPILEIRMIKEPAEIDLLRKAAQLGNAGFLFLQGLFKEGVSEAELALELELFWKRRGSKGVAFEPIIAFGANASMPHYRAGETHLEKGMAILVDIGVNLHHYHSDKTRVFFYGDVAETLQKIYAIIHTAQAAAIAIAKPGTPIGALDRAARSVIEDAGYGSQFTHSLGHGVGLEIHELPMLRNKGPWAERKLEEGMVITIEPGIYLPDVGGVRYEDTLVITANGNEIIT